MPISITFSGNNTQYTGTLSLHPLIDTISFTNQDAIIKNINFPNSIPNTGSDKDTVPFVKSNKPRTLTISVPFDDNNNFDCTEILTIPNNTVIHVSNLKNTKRYKFINSISNKPITLIFDTSKVSQSKLKILDISNKEYVPVEYIEQTFFIPDDNIIAARFDYSIGEKGTCLYYYTKNINCSCGGLLSLKNIKPKVKLLDNESIIKYLNTDTCSNCKTTIDETSINPTLVSCLYPVLQENDRAIQSHCTNGCGQIGWVFINNVNDRNINNSYYVMNAAIDNNKCPTCNHILVYDKEYFQKQIYHLTIPDGWVCAIPNKETEWNGYTAQGGNYDSSQGWH